MTRVARLRLLVLLALGSGLAAQQAVALQKAVAIAPATIRLNPDQTSATIGTIQPGATVGIQAQSGGFVQVFSGVSGWAPNHGLVLLSNPQAAEILFGAAVRLESQAEASSGEQIAAQNAARLYLRVYEDFPQASRAAEALYRGAAIRWQLGLSGEPRRRTPSERQFPDTGDLRRVVKKFGGTPWAARADYDLLVTHFTCGDWSEKPSCLGKEADRYRDYVKKYPHGPKSAEAAYDALYREAIAWTIYQQPGKTQDLSQAQRYREQAEADAAQIERAYAGTDWAALATLAGYDLRQGTPMIVPGLTPLGGP